MDSTICVRLLGSGRIEKLAKPLSTVGVKCSYGNNNKKSHIDAIITDIPGTSLLRAAGLAASNNCPLIYRMRGNYWQELRTNGHFPEVRSFIANNFIFPLCEGICIPDAYLQTEVERRTRFSGHTSVVEIPKNAAAFPTVRHIKKRCNLLTLTNFRYRDKIEPLYDYLESAERVLENYEGMWFVAGDGEFAKEFQSRVTDYNNISYVGFVDPIEYLPQSAVMIHISKFDIASPNAILEGMAAGLPVIVNDHQPFFENERAITVNSTAEFEVTLQELLEDPSRRREIGQKNRTYVQRNHSTKVIGTKLRTAIERVLPES